MEEGRGAVALTVSCSRLLLIAAVVAIAGFLSLMCMGVPSSEAQDPEEQEAPEVDPRFDEPFGAPQYLIHLTGTHTMDGFVEKDSYLLYHTAPDAEGVFLTADGSGGTFTNTGELIGGPYSTPRDVCAAARDLPVSTFNAWNSNYAFGCATVPTAGGGGVPMGVWVAGGVAVAGVAGIGLALGRRRRRSAAATRPVLGSKLGLAVPSIVSPAPPAIPNAPTARSEQLTREIEDLERRVDDCHNRLAAAETNFAAQQRSLQELREDLRNLNWWLDKCSSGVSGALGVLAVMMGVGVLRWFSKALLTSAAEAEALAATLQAQRLPAGHIAEFYTGHAATITRATQSAAGCRAGAAGATKAAQVLVGNQGTAIAGTVGATTSDATAYGFGYLAEWAQDGYDRMHTNIGHIEALVAQLRSGCDHLEHLLEIRRSDLASIH